MLVKYINEFIFDKAQYVIRDTNGKSLLLVVDYMNNSFDIQQNQTDNELLKQEAAEIAKDLLSRKCGVNLAEKE